MASPADFDTVRASRTPETVRFSPAPTGGLHLGGARTALMNWLVARGSGGRFIVRIEDTDTDRCDLACEAGIAEDLAWLGLDWDEGPEVGGPHAPYRQSDRCVEDVYTSAIERLAEDGSAYACFCTAADLEHDRAADERAGLAPRYHGACCDLSVDEATDRLEAGEPATWRFRVPPGPPVRFDDLVHGPIVFERDAIGDFIVARSDGRPVYDLAAAVDDIAMDVTLVLRGDDHLSNTPRQILLIEALGATAPRYAHVPLVNGTDGRPLSKSRGAAGIADLREAGYLPEAVVNHVALLGWSDPAHREVLSREDLVAAFELSRVSRSAAESDPTRLDWLDQQHIRALSTQRMRREVGGVLPRPLPLGFDLDAFVEGVRGELTTLHDAAVLALPLLERPEFDPAAREALASTPGRVAVAIAAAALDSGITEGTEFLAALKRDLADGSITPRVGLPTVRAALTGQAHGLGIGLIVDVIGATESRDRLRAASM
jgi:nondiscriminating glutamyl-tRNA synthetase